MLGLILSTKKFESNSNSLLTIENGNVILERSVSETNIKCSLVVLKNATIELPLKTELSGFLNIIEGLQLN